MFDYISELLMTAELTVQLLVLCNGRAELLGGLGDRTRLWAFLRMVVWK